MDEVNTGHIDIPGDVDWETTMSGTGWNESPKVDLDDEHLPPPVKPTDSEMLEYVYNFCQRIEMLFEALGQSPQGAMMARMTGLSPDAFRK